MHIYVTVHLQTKRNKKPPWFSSIGKAMEPLGVILVPCFLLATCQTTSQLGVSKTLSFYTPNILCLVVLSCALLYTRDYTATHFFLQPTGYYCSGQKSSPYLALMLSWVLWNKNAVINSSHVWPDREFHYLCMKCWVPVPLTLILKKFIIYFQIVFG